MTEVVANGPVLSDSTFRTRPNFSSYLYVDTNAGGNAVQQIETHRRARHMKFPTLTGRGDVDSFTTSVKTDIGYKKWNDEGDFRSNAPYRDYDNIVDPVSGFVSAGGDVDRNTGRKKINSLVQLNETPQAVPPQEKNSDRKKEQKAPPELRRSNTYEPGAPSMWNSRSVSDIWIRSQLGGWTSDYDPRQPAPEMDKWRSKSAFVPKPPSEQSRDGRDHLAMKYKYGTSTQKSFEEVPWDNMLHPKQWAPVSTLEQRPDMISQTYTLKRYDPAAQEWQSTGRSWDWFQKRQGYYKNQPIVFCSANPRAQQIPSYGGSIGADNLDEIDNAQEPFNPYTVKRVNIPRYSETGHRPNIPGYKGCTLWRGVYAPAHQKSQATTAITHKSLPISPNTSEHKKDSQMSRMVTTVPPCNPFNQINKLDEIIATTKAVA
ncbi:protein SPMIP7-like [Argopecten irradians]|uniref:protein SPMIP7-like n=1 Tax=Argopecten irradians TaxID=31199 RepID=UPI00371C329F